ncbi:MAG: PAS domain S-box protein [Balneolaceae bacterium]|nr:PAS domain S-box protein [Balneolaceae bacterium]
MTTYNGRPAKIVLAKDVTEQVKAERELKLSEQKFKALVQEGTDMISVLDSDGFFNYTSPNFQEITGWSTGELHRKNAFDFIHSDDLQQVKQVFEQVIKEGKGKTEPFRFQHKEGHWLWIESNGSNLSESAVIDGIIVNSHDITDRHYYTKLEKLERDILEKNTLSEISYPNLVKQFLVSIVNLHPQMKCSIMQIRDEKLYNFISPSLPEEYLQEVHGAPIGPNEGSCGTAAYTKELVISENIFKDPRWEDFRHLGEQYNFSACWSQPIFNSRQQVVSTFAVYYEEPTAPSDRELNTVKRAAHILRVLYDSFEKERAEHQLVLSEQRFRSFSRR